MKPCNLLVQFIAQHGNHRKTSTGIRNKMAPEAKLVLFRTIFLCRLDAYPPGWSVHSYVCRLFSRFNHFHWDNSSPDSPPSPRWRAFVAGEASPTVFTQWRVNWIFPFCLWIMTKKVTTGIRYSHDEADKFLWVVKCTILSLCFFSLHWTRGK